MKHLRIAIIVSVVILSACNNQSVDTAPSAAPSVAGQFTAIKNKRIIIAGADSTTQYSDLAQAYFYTVPGDPTSFADVGAVTVNEQPMVKNSGNIYSLESADLGLNFRTLWSAPNAGASKTVIYNDSTDFPAYVGPLPSAINKNLGFSFQVYDTSFVYADSFRIYIGDNTSGVFVQKIVAAQPGAVNFSAAELAPLTPSNLQQGIIGVIPFTGHVHVFGNKTYYFTKESRVIKSIDIN